MNLIRVTALLGIFLLGAISPEQGRAQTPEQGPPAADIRCLLIGSLMVANSTGATQRSAGLMLSIYWVGRLDSFSRQQIEDAMVSEARGMTPTQIQTETVRCGDILQAKGQMMQDIGNNIIRRSKEMDKQNATPAPNDSKPPTQ